MTEYALGALAACGAGFFSNPIEVVKTRLQLQGELKARGHYQRHYRNPFQAFYAIAKKDGILGLQKGLGPALVYQSIMNGIRLGTYQVLLNSGITRDKDGNQNGLKCVAAGCFSGMCGAFTGSPIYMIKTHMQAQASSTIAVGYQHNHISSYQALRDIYSKFGIRGLWRGASGTVTRTMVGSGVQLSTFTVIRGKIVSLDIFSSGSVLVPISASFVSGILVSLCMTPFDVVSTRLFNQAVDSSGRGQYYNGLLDCFIKTVRKEGVLGLYKGLAASYLRLGPHTALSLVFWDRLRRLYHGKENI